MLLLLSIVTNNKSCHKKVVEKGEIVEINRSNSESLSEKYLAVRRLLGKNNQSRITVIQKKGEPLAINR